MSQPFLPYGKQDITEEDKQAVLDALDAPYLTTGPKVQQFEHAFAEKVNAQYATSFSSATAALHIACLAFGIERGDTVLAPTMSFAASSNCAAYLGARIEFMDCDPVTGLVTPETFAEAAERASRAGHPAKLAVVVHLNGEAADMPAIWQEAEKRGIKLIEDACHAVGTLYTDHEGKQRMIGSCQYSEAASFSFHPVKTITTGEGGMLTTSNHLRDAQYKRLRSHGIVRDSTRFTIPELALDAEGRPNPWYYEMQELGYNYRLTDIACALGLTQLSRLDDIMAKRRAMKKQYDDLFSGAGLPLRPVPTADACDPVRHLYPVLVDFEEAGITRAEFCTLLRDVGVGTQVHYIPTHLQPFYRKLNGEMSLPGAEAYYEKVVSLPFYPGLSEEDIKRVVSSVADLLN